MQNASVSSGFLTWNSSWNCLQTPSEMGKKRIRVRYTELTTLLNIFKVTVDMD